ncbi:MAG: hypothetical protein A2Z99_13750 [Treponema sp. GWB1_62_6]|nr:MAG: hypothetical protein A2Y36_07735 [Treponema sp. GWA1_62_8]OHE64958.1 MAG: hypothetical protein A2Z99_13750 [Treponema sp. GWB1_62_6]OHE67021.1 MAG: hypothetical protein A2001_08245 [Treponema sp. GWC1_61_84]OHE70932.1 MAG: hypothetical protein A2413_13440 [Treponema sp. RIFOXYC1_FULL_61_9]HCM27353.1 hypothetical protein [Treponema sp.]
MKRLLLFIQRFFRKPQNRRLSALVALGLVALADAALSGTARRTFVFHRLHNGRPAVEMRMLHIPKGLEARIAQYVEETLLGPGAEGSGRLFDKEASLEFLMVRDAVAYVDLSPEAALPAGTEKAVRRPLRILRDGMLRNFPALDKVVFFIGGQEPYIDDDEASEASYDPAKKPKSVDK